LVEGHHNSDLKQKDFVKVEQEIDSDGSEDNWTDQEVLLLLEALEVGDDDWNAVADQVGTKTREQCVMKFLQLEIEDKYLESDVPQGEVSGGPPGKFLRDLEYLAEGRIPFFHGDNPILSVVSFMAGLAPANVTEVAVAAKRSVSQMKQDLEKQMAKIGTEKGKEKEKTTEGDVKNEDVMEVDAAQNAVSLTGDAQEANPLATLPFALSAARASALASHEERHITRLVSGAVNLQLQKLDLKMKHFNDFEKLLSAERRDLQRRRQQLFMDRLAFQRRVRALEDVTKKISGNMGGQGLPGAMNPEDAVAALTEAIRTFGVGKGEEAVGVKRDSVDGGVQPIAEDAEGFGKIEV
jgi:SWI/SNF related-matrix-associated actin-dependent regulator of chromatin subfamily C